MNINELEEILKASKDSNNIDSYWQFVLEVSKRVKARPEWQRGAIDRPYNVLLVK